MSLRQGATVKRSFTIPELHARHAKIGTHRPPSTKAGLAGWQVARSRNPVIYLNSEARRSGSHSNPQHRRPSAVSRRNRDDSSTNSRTMVLVSQASTVQEAIQQYREHQPHIT